MWSLTQMIIILFLSNSFLTFFRALGETECLTIQHKITIWTELCIMTWVFCDLSNLKGVCVQQYSIIKQNYYIQDWAWEGPKVVSRLHGLWPRCPWPILLLCCLFPFSLHLWPQWSSVEYWEIILHGSLTFLHVFWAKELTGFVHFIFWRMSVEHRALED